jgi:hypothetical protein
VPPTFASSTSARSLKDNGQIDDEFTSRSRSSASLHSIQAAQKRSASPRPHPAVGSTMSPSRRARSDIDAIAKYKLERAAQMVGADEAESSDERFQSPPTSPRRVNATPTSPRSSPKRLRRMSIGGTSGSTTAIQHAIPPVSSVSSLSLTTPTSSIGPIPQLAATKLDSTLLWADFLEATHLVATCPLFKPKEPTDTIELASFHFYIFSLQSPPSESSSRKEKAKSSGGGRDDSPSPSPSPSGQHVHIEESPALSKLYRKALHKNVGAFYPPRLMSSTSKGTNLEDSIWSAYTDHVGKKYSIEDAMQEYTKIFNQWRYSDVRLFFEVKREVSALLTPKSSILAINEDGVAVLKKDKDNELVASYLYTNIVNWTVVGNSLSLEVLVDDSVTSGPSGSTISDSVVPSSSSNLSVTGMSSASSLQTTANSTNARSQFATSGITTSVTFISQQAETISAIMQVYLDRLTGLMFERSDSLRSQPSPRIFLQTDIEVREQYPTQSAHQIAVESLTPALNQLKEERGDFLGASSTSDSDRESSSNLNILHSLSADTISPSAARKNSAATPITNVQSPSGPSSPLLGRKRAPSLPRSQLDQRLESLRISEIPTMTSHGEEGFISEDGPRRQSSKTKRSGNSRLTNSKGQQSDAESRGSESDKDHKTLASPGGNMDGSESDHILHSRPDSPLPPIQQSDLSIGNNDPFPSSSSSTNETASTST